MGRWDSGTVGRCDGATVRRCDGATVRRCDGATVRRRDSGTVRRWDDTRWDDTRWDKRSSLVEILLNIPATTVPERSIELAEIQDEGQPVMRLHRGCGGRGKQIIFREAAEVRVNNPPSPRLWRAGPVTNCSNDKINRYVLRKEHSETRIR
ncbi:hypothetical protein ACFLT1_05735 [Bacteroidota bacterium]